MGIIWLRCSAELRARWRAVVVMALIVGIGGGVALSAFGGALRTDTAMASFVSYSLPDDGGFIYGSPSAPPCLPDRRRTPSPPPERCVGSCRSLR